MTSISETRLPHLINFETHSLTLLPLAAKYGFTQVLIKGLNQNIVALDIFLCTEVLYIPQKLKIFPWILVICT